MRARYLATLGLIALLLNACSNETSLQEQAVQNETSPTVSTQAEVKEENQTEEAKEKETHPPLDWQNAEVNEENVKRALNNNIHSAMAIPFNDETFRKFVSSEDLNGQYIELTINPGLFADEKDFVKRAGGSLVAYSKILFQNPLVYEVSLVVNIDNVGGGENQGVYISWRRNQTKNIDYDKVLEQLAGDYSIPYTMSRKYLIQNELYNTLTDFRVPQEKGL